MCCTRSRTGFSEELEQKNWGVEDTTPFKKGVIGVVYVDSSIRELVHHVTLKSLHGKRVLLRVVGGREGRRLDPIRKRKIQARLIDRMGW